MLSLPSLVQSLLSLSRVETPPRVLVVVDALGDQLSNLTSKNINYLLLAFVLPRRPHHDL